MVICISSVINCKFHVNCKAKVQIAAMCCGLGADSSLDCALGYLHPRILDAKLHVVELTVDHCACMLAACTPAAVVEELSTDVDCRAVQVSECL